MENGNHIRDDPFQIYKVVPQPCLKLEVKVLCGRNITKGWSDYFDTPDIYIRLYVRKAPEGRKSTTVKDNKTNPVWDESFQFFLNSSSTGDNIMDIAVMESNYGPDTTVTKMTFDLKELKLDTPLKKTFTFNEVSEIDIEMTMSTDHNPSLRYSSILCEQEKEFLAKRKSKTLIGLQQLLGERGPKSSEEAPTIAVIGSGGGFRAMVGLNGVFNALHDSGILQCTTFVSGLSGSSWFISTLYSNEGWPSKTTAELEDQLKDSIDNSIVWQFNPVAVTRHVNVIMEKRRRGQPVSFTDFFGRMVGEILLNDRLEARLSDQRTKLADGGIPLPLLTCVHAKKDRSAQSFHEWVEFSPYEVGIAKYGIFMPTELFGSKFFLGRICKSYTEQPLHYLQGVWGSAYSIMFNRYDNESNEQLSSEDSIREEMIKQMDQSVQDDSSDSSEDEGEMDDDTNQTPRHESKQTQMRTKQSGYWSDLLKSTFLSKDSALMNTRGHRAGVIHNFLRGLSLSQTFSKPKEPTDETDAVSPTEAVGGIDLFDGMYEKSETKVKHQYMVDAGLAFNSPYPIVMRSQREVDIILSFDFSARNSDATSPFSEINLAALWAKKHKVPFPPVDTTELREPYKEVYVFKHPTDPYCPVVLHFPLINNEFKNFIKPDVKRSTKEELEFGNFSIFDEPKTPYSTFNFTYSAYDFDRLSKLTEFNTLVTVETIKDVIADVIEIKKKRV